MFTLQHPPSTMDMQVDSLTHTSLGLEYSIRDFPSGIPGWDGAVDSLGENDRSGQWRLAFPSQFSVCSYSDLYRVHQSL